MEARIERVASPGDADTPESNAWIVGDDDEVIVVDPGRDAGAVLSAVGDREILAVICTHGHAAHVAAAPAVAARDEAPVALNHRDRLPGGGGPPRDHPGHTLGSVCLYSEELEAVFAGDSVAADGPVLHDGQYTDFPAQLSAIGEHLLTLPGPTRVLPGHGEEITVSAIQKKFDSWVNAGPLLRSTDPD